MRLAGLVLTMMGVALAASPATAADLVAIRPGVMCSSAEALGKLTLPGGDSRTHAPSPRAEDLAVAGSGGCIDIPLGARVTVQQAFRNTSIVTYDGVGGMAAGPMVVPNIDFQPATSGAQAPAAAMQRGSAFPTSNGYSVAQRMPAGGTGGDTLVILRDQRITPALEQKMEGNGGDTDLMFKQGDPLKAEFERHPFLNAQLLLVSASGAVIAQKRLERPLADIKPAPLHGLPSPAFLFTVDYSSGMGGFSGPATQLLVPSERGLDPVTAVAERGGVGGGPIQLASTLHTLWQIVPARSGGTEEIESTFCQPGSGEQTLRTYQTYRFQDGRWVVSSRQHNECGPLDLFPPRREFP